MLRRKCDLVDLFSLFDLPLSAPPRLCKVEFEKKRGVLFLCFLFLMSDRQLEEMLLLMLLLGAYIEKTSMAHCPGRRIISINNRVDRYCRTGVNLCGDVHWRYGSIGILTGLDCDWKEVTTIL